MAKVRTPNPEIGSRFTRLVVLAQGQIDSQKWVCQCDCGNISTARKSHLLAGKHRSCGCLQRDVASMTHRTHGERGTGLYRIWCNIKSRTTNPNVPCYPRYGGRGISMCPEWFNSFEEFCRGVGPRQKGMTLDRIDNDGRYEPGNVRWVPHKVNCRNRSRRTVVTAWGLTLQLHEWTQITGVGSELIRDRIRNRRWVPEDSVATPPKSTRFSLMPDDDPHKVSVLKRVKEANSA